MNETERVPFDESQEHQTAGPRVEYVGRREARLAEAASQMQRFRKFGIVRLASLAIGLVLLWFVWFSGLSLWWLLAPVFVFVVLAETQSRISVARRRCERAAALYDLGIARLADRWAGTGATGERFFDAAHPYAGDLDLFGHGSLFELLSLARTRAGEVTLSDRVLHSVSPYV